MNTRPQPSRQGLSLLELLLTLAITAILLVAVSSSILTHYQTTDAGERQIEAARATYAWTHRLGRDLSTLPRTSKNELLANQLFETSVRERVLSMGPGFSLDPIVLWGNQQLLVLGRLVPAVNNARGQVPKLTYEAIVWTSLPIEQWQLPYPSPQGIVFKRVGDSNETADATAARDLHAAPQRAVIAMAEQSRLMDRATFPFPQAGLVFRYFDGQKWLDNWNANNGGQLPVAVEANMIKPALPVGGLPQDDLRFVFHLRNRESEE